MYQRKWITTPFGQLRNGKVAFQGSSYPAKIEKFWILDAGCWILGTRFWVLGSGY